MTFIVQCNQCGEDITFDKYHVSDKSGKKIPLDPDTYEPHDCVEFDSQIYCNLCDKPIEFDDDYVSERTGKKIPLDIDTGEPHDCKVWKQQKRYLPCRKGCGKSIYFDKNNEYGLSESGKYVPLDKETGEPHQCEGRQGTDI